MKLYAVKNDEGNYWSGYEEEFVNVTDITIGDTLFEDRQLVERIAEENGGEIVEFGELPKQPVKEFVTVEEAEMLERAKPATKDALMVIEAYIVDNVLHDDMRYQDLSASQDRLMRAYANGYEVEKEKRYYVKVPHTKFDYYGKDYNNQGHVVIRTVREEQLDNNSNQTCFSQSDIEKYDLQDCERVEVEE